MSFGEDAQEIGLEGIPLSFIVGPNNSGKSNIFRALNFVGELITNRYPSSALLSQYMHPGAQDLEIAVSVKLDAEEFEALRNFMECTVIPSNPVGTAEEQRSIASKVKETISKNEDSLFGGLGNEFKLIVRSTQSGTSPLEHYFQFKWDEHEFALISEGRIVSPETPHTASFATIDLETLLFSTPKQYSQHDESKPPRPSDVIFSRLSSEMIRNTGAYPAVLISPVNFTDLERRLGVIEPTRMLRAFLKSREYHADSISLAKLLTIVYNSSIVWIGDLRGSPQDGIRVVSERAIERTDQPFQIITGFVELPRIRQINGRDLVDRLHKLMTSPRRIEYQAYSIIKDKFEKFSGGLDFRVYIDEMLEGEKSLGQPRQETFGPADNVSQQHAKIIKVLRIGISDGKVEWPLDLASAGTVELLTLLTGTIGAKESVLLIDEPVQNLHPEFQYRFRQLLSSLAETENKQIIIITHSPFLIDIQDLHNTWYVTRSSGITRTLRLMKVLQESDPKLAKKAMQYFDSSDIRSLLFSRGAVFVEGLSDKFVISVAEMKASLSGEGAGLTENEWVIVCMGSKNNIKTFHKLAELMKLSHVFILDSDARSDIESIVKEEGIKDLNEKDIQNKGFFLLKGDMDDIVGIQGKGKPLKAFDKLQETEWKELPEELKDIIRFIKNKIVESNQADNT